MVSFEDGEKNTRPEKGTDPGVWISCVLGMIIYIIGTLVYKCFVPAPAGENEG